MTAEERCKRPEHHVVHDYANLVSSWRLREPDYIVQLMRIPTANSHAWHAFYLNCRKMYEFFRYGSHEDYLRAEDFIGGKLPYKFQDWTDSVQEFMNTHMLHVGGGRITNKKVSTGEDDRKYFSDFENAWEAMMGNLKPEHRDVFRNEIDFRLTDREFQFCGTLGKEFIL
jgi:hypothetical protein